MPEPESKDPKEESSSGAHPERDASDSLSGEDDGGSGKNAPNESDQETDSKDPKEESSSIEDSKQEDFSSLSKEDAEDLHESTSEGQKDSPASHPGLIRHVVMGVLLVAALAGLWQDQKARRQLDVAAEDLMFRLKGMRNFDDNDVHALMGKPDISDEGSRYADLYEEYIWEGVFNTYHMQLTYTVNFGRAELDGVRSHSKLRWASGNKSMGVEDQRPEIARQMANQDLEEEMRRRLKKPDGIISKEEYLLIDKIDMAGKEVQDLTSIARMSALQNLNLNDNHLTDLSPLKSLTRVEILRLRHNSLQHLDSITHMTRLRELDAGYNVLTHTDALLKLSQITRLTLNDNRIIDIAPLSKLRRLEWLDLNRNQLTDISLLGELRNLQLLRLSGNKIQDVKPLANLQALEVLYLAKNQIIDIRALAKMPHLGRLYLADNQVTDVASLAEIKNLGALDLTGNPVPKSEVEALRKALPMCQIDF